MRISGRSRQPVPSCCIEEPRSEASRTGSIPPSMYLVSFSRLGRSSMLTRPWTTTLTASQPKAVKAPPVSTGMIDWMREAISVGFCQLKVKSSRTPRSGNAGWNSRKVSGSR